ncbi:MAG: DUF302 domain-containing protein [Candidatus Nanohaloarchaea archaeon]|nr:DUF302 domain-containing protein [Candidatus Nanohaloarchaea archaeon]
MVSEGEGIRTVSVDTGVETAVDRVKSAVDDSPAEVMAVFDHRENAASVGRDLPPTTVVVFGNPELGTPLLRAYRTLGLDLPQRMLVYEDDGQTRIAYNDTAHLFDRHGVDDDDAEETITQFLESIADSVRE